MLSIVLFFAFISNINADISFRVDPCPQILNCKCLDENVNRVQCFGVGATKIEELSKIYGKNIEELEFENWKDELIHFDVFSTFPKLNKLKFKGGEITNLNLTEEFSSLRQLSLDNVELKSVDDLCRIIDFIPNIQKLSVKSNELTEFDCESGDSIKELDISKNKISKANLPKNIQKLDISQNSLSNIDGMNTTQLTHLDISKNVISSWPKEISFPKLLSLNSSNLNIPLNFTINAPLLEELVLDQSQFTFVDFHRIKTPNLKKLSAKKLDKLVAISGKISQNIETINLTETKVHRLPNDFFGTQKQLKSTVKSFDFSSSKLQCDPCLLLWSLPVFDQSKIHETCNITRENILKADCEIGMANSTEEAVYGLYGQDTIIDCLAYGTPQPIISWYRYRPSNKLGSYDGNTDQIDYTNVTELSRQSYSILSGGNLVIHNANRSHVERYVCVVENEKGNKWKIIHFRLDYTNWYGLNVFKSVFWGGLAMSLIVCFVSFLLNITWILTRKSALWWIQRAERLSRVRKMVEAMEKYRTRQMDSLHDKYTKRVQLVRDNYHQQVEALRVSYSSQSEKFRDYRAAQMDAVSSHLESMRDNYNTQLARVREYGSKRAEQLWESYERQVNRMRTFSLQHRLKLMRQYKVKQRYLNKLLESLQTQSPDVQLENEEKVRAALDIDEPVDLGLDTGSRLSRSSSFHSLPEYLIDERGNVQPGIPASSAAIRFSAIPTTSNISPKMTEKVEKNKDEPGPSTQ